jgi:hypothetical protein
MSDINRDTVKKWATDIVSLVTPDETFVIEDGFDDIAENWDAAVSQDEGRFIGGPEVASFAGVLVPFLLVFLGDVAKDVAKDTAKQVLGALLDKLLSRRASSDEASRLKEELRSAITSSRFSKTQKNTLLKGFDNLFAKIQPPG